MPFRRDGRLSLPFAAEDGKKGIRGSDTLRVAGTAGRPVRRIRSPCSLPRLATRSAYASGPLLRPLSRPCLPQTSPGRFLQVPFLRLWSLTFPPPPRSREGAACFKSRPGQTPRTGPFTRRHNTAQAPLASLPSGKSSENRAEKNPKKLARKNKTLRIENSSKKRAFCAPEKNI